MKKLYNGPKSAGVRDDGQIFFGGDPAAHEKTAEAGRVLRRAVDALSEDFCTVVFDTDHLAGSHLTRLALAAAETCVVPCPTDTGEFHRLFQTPDSSQFEGVESLFGEVWSAQRLVL
jgi:cellulose biosynthesis protein BcsQ